MWLRKAGTGFSPPLIFDLYKKKFWHQNCLLSTAEPVPRCSRVYLCGVVTSILFTLMSLFYSFFDSNNSFRVNLVVDARHKKPELNHLHTCSFTLLSNQPIVWQQHKAFNHVQITFILNQIQGEKCDLCGFNCRIEVYWLVSEIYTEQRKFLVTLNKHC